MFTPTGANSVTSTVRVGRATRAQAARLVPASASALETIVLGPKEGFPTEH